MLPQKPTMAPPRGPPPAIAAPKPPATSAKPTEGAAAEASTPKPVSGKAAEIALAQQALDNYAVAESAGRYRMHKLIGKGAYGAVYTAYDTTSPTPRKVAIKHIVNAFVSPTDARRIYREIKVMAHFNHPNILPLVEVIKPRDPAGFSHIYLVSELMETDLHRVIHSRQDLTSDHISYFVYQTLCGLKHIHTAGVLHRDLKPSNLLVNADCTVRMCDFGLARESEPSMSAAFTEYVVTRWYRAPEVLLSGGKYKTSVDVWAVGCVLAELLLRRPLFPGDNYLHQLQLVTEVLGSPSEADLHFVRSEAARNFMLRLPRYDPIPLPKVFPHVRGPCLDLLARMLTFDPERRISVDEALAHPFLARVRAARRHINEEACGVPRPFRLQVPGGSAGLRAMSVDAIKGRFYAELCGLLLTPTPTSAPAGPLFEVGALDESAVAAAAAAAAAAAGAGAAGAGAAGGSITTASSSSSFAMVESPAGGRPGSSLGGAGATGAAGSSSSAAAAAAAAGVLPPSGPEDRAPQEWRRQAYAAASSSGAAGGGGSSAGGASASAGPAGAEDGAPYEDGYDHDDFSEEFYRSDDEEEGEEGEGAAAGAYAEATYHHGGARGYPAGPPSPHKRPSRTAPGGGGGSMDVDGVTTSAAALGFAGAAGGARGTPGRASLAGPGEAAARGSAHASPLHPLQQQPPRRPSAAGR